MYKLYPNSKSPLETTGHNWRRLETRHNWIFPVGHPQVSPSPLSGTWYCHLHFYCALLYSASTSTSSYLYRYLTTPLHPHPISSYLSPLVVVSCYVLLCLGLAWPRRSSPHRPSLFPRRFPTLLLSSQSVTTVTVCSTPTVHYCPLLSTLPNSSLLVSPSPSSSLLPSFLPSQIFHLQRLRPSCDFPFYICETQSQDIRLILHTPALSSRLQLHFFTRLLPIYSIPSLFYSRLYHTQPIYLPGLAGRQK